MTLATTMALRPVLEGGSAALGAALLHFVWEAGAVAALVALSQRRAASARTRYAWNCVALLSLPVVFVATLAWMYAGGVAGWTTAMLARYMWMPQAEVLPYVAGLWGLGVLVMAARTLGGWVWLHRARREMSERVPAAWREALQRLRQRMGVAAEVGLGVSARVLSPCAAGWWRPLILLPASALAGIAPEQMEALLAHELAHIARRDYLVNLAQRGIEVMFFYHPAVWWLSAQVTQEREHCCDDCAIAACGDRVAYARALVDCAAAAAPARELACAASGGELRPRVLRILGAPARPAPARVWAAATLALSLLGAGAWLHAPVPAPAAPAAVRVRFTPAVARLTPTAVAPHQARAAGAARTTLAALTRVLPTPSAPAVAAVTPPRPERPATHAMTAAAAVPTTPVVQPRQFVAFTFTAVESCTPQWQVVSTVTPDGQNWISLEPVMSCVPVLQPTEVWVSNL